MMQRLMACLGLGLLVTVVPAVAGDSSVETSTPKTATPSQPPAPQAPAPSTSNTPNARASGDIQQGAPAPSSLKDYCREHTC